MTKETEVALAAIDALCKKRKAKALRKLVLAAVESERTPYHGIYSGGVTLTDVSGVSSSITTDASPHYTETYTAKGPM